MLSCYRPNMESDLCVPNDEEGLNVYMHLKLRIARLCLGGINGSALPPTKHMSRAIIQKQTTNRLISTLCDVQPKQTN